MEDDSGSRLDGGMRVLFAEEKEGGNVSAVDRDRGSRTDGDQTLTVGGMALRRW